MKLGGRTFANRFAPRGAGATYMLKLRSHRPTRIGRRLEPGAASRPDSGPPAVAVNRSNVRTGMDVVGIDGEQVGRIKEVCRADFLVDRMLQRDIYVPLDAVQVVIERRIVLTVRGDRVDNRGWANPPLWGPP